MELTSTGTNPFRSAGLFKHFNCPTPDSMLSTGSGSVYSNLVARSSSFLLPEKLQIVKPIECSQTLQHWQHLARPNLGCLFEARPGISVKRASPEVIKSNCLVDADTSISLEYDEDSDAGVNDMFGDEFGGEYADLETNNSSELLSNFDYQRSEYDYAPGLVQYNNNYSSGNLRVLSPGRVQMLSNLLRGEETKEFPSTQTPEVKGEVKGKESSFFFDLLNKCFSNNTDSGQRPLQKQRVEYCVF